MDQRSLRREVIFGFIVAALLLFDPIPSEAAGDDPGVHDPAAHAGAGLKKELTAGITPADFLKLGDKPKTVKVTLVATFTGANSGMNFNGFSHGEASYIIPVGWTIEVTFINPSPVPHSVIVVERDMLRKPQMGDPAFKGASTPEPKFGMSTGEAAFVFTASEPGEYAFACGIPTHASAGHWVKLEISAQAKTPVLKLGAATSREAN